MNISQKSKVTLYFIAALVGYIVCGVYIYSLVKAYQVNDRSNLFMSGAILLIWIGFTIMYTFRFLREKKIKENNGAKN